MQAVPITVCWLCDLRLYLNQLLPQEEGQWYLCVEKYCAWVGGNCELFCGNAKEFPRVDPLV